MVRCEACRGLYRLSLIKDDPCLIELMDALLDFLPLAQSLQSKGTSNPSTGHGKNLEPCAQEYFAILCRLVDSLPIEEENKVRKKIFFLFKFVNTLEQTLGLSKSGNC